MTDILQTIIQQKRSELNALRAPKPSLRQALLSSPTGIIAEFKRRSPSRGWIHQDGRADQIPLAYQQAGAAAVSILTDQHFFGGQDSFVTEARQSGVQLPILYKNFVIDPIQLHQALLCGASAVLLIAACLSREACRRLMDEAHALGLEVLLELHNDNELEYADLSADCIGINNRHLGTFQTDVNTSLRLASRLRQQVPATTPLVSESGISSPATVHQLRQAGFSGFLIGETFMRQPSPAQALATFISELNALQTQQPS